MRSWYRNNINKSRNSGRGVGKKDDGQSIAAALLSKKRRHRAPQRVEIYQKLYPERVNAALEAAGMDGGVASEDMGGEEDKDSGGDNDGEEDVIDSDSSEELKAKVKKAAAKRMRDRRAVSTTLLANESGEVKAEIEAELGRIKLEKLESKTASDDAELTPDLAQK